MDSGLSFGRSSSTINNSWANIIKYEDGVRTVLAERSLGFQFASGKTYTISLTVAPDFSATMHVSDGVSTDQVTSPATVVSFPFDQFFIADIEGGISSTTREAGNYSLRFDDVLVREISPDPLPCATPPVGLVGWWKGDGDASDFVGNNEGSLQGGVSFAGGKVGQGFLFDGNDDVVSIPDSPTLKPAQVTVDAWVKFNSLDSTTSGAPPGHQYLIFKQNSRTANFEGYNLLKIRITEGEKFLFGITSANGTAASAYSTTMISVAQWYHVAGSYDGSNVKIYVNGNLEGSTPATLPLNYGTQPVFLGSSDYPPFDGKLNGVLDEVDVFDRALSDLDVQGIFNAGSAGKCDATLLPTITSVTPQLSGFFLQGTNFNNLYRVGVDWKGSTPGTLRFAVNDNTPVQITANAMGGSYTFALNNFTPSFSPTIISVVATNAEGASSAPWRQEVFVFPYPRWLREISANAGMVQTVFGNGEIRTNVRFQFPQPRLGNDTSINIPQDVPFLGGRFGPTDTFADVAASISSTGTGSGSLRGKAGFTVGGNELEGDLGGSGAFTFNRSGLRLTNFSFNGGVSGTIKTKEVRITQAIPTIAALETVFPPIKFFSKRATLQGTISPSVNLALKFAQNSGGDLAFKDATGEFGLELKAVLKARLIDKRLTAEGWVAGGGRGTYGVPGSPFVREAKITFEAGATFTLDALINVDYTAKFVRGCMWMPGAGVRCGADGDEAHAFSFIKPSTTQTRDVPVSLIKPNYRKFGRYSVFNLHAAKNVQTATAGRSLNSDALNSSTPSVVSNVFPGASPKLLELPFGKLLLWVHQDASLPVLQSTGISWSYINGNGNGATAPALVANDTRAELSPVAARDANGRAVAAWLRVKDPTFTATIDTASDLPLFYKRLEVVTALFDPSSRTWSAVTPLTDDGALDTSLKLSSDKDGRLLLTWLSNADAELMSTTNSPSTLKYSVWNGAQWSAPAVIAENLIGVNDYAVSLMGSKAFVVLPRIPAQDGHGVLDLYRFDESGWSAGSSFAAGEADNRLPSAIYSSDGTGHIVWLRGGDLVHATLSDATPRLVRTGSDSLSFYDAQLFVNPAGNLTVLWQQPGDEGVANLFAAIYDTASATWSDDRLLHKDAALLHNFSGYYDADGMLHLTHLATTIERTTKTVTLDGETQIINNIPQNGRTDLRLLDHRLGYDLAVADSDLSLSPNIPHAGATATTALDVHNAGDFAISGFSVKLYPGDPANAGAPLATATFPEALRAGDHRIVSLPLTIPSNGIGKLVAVVEAVGGVTEITTANNRATLNFTGVFPPITLSPTADAFVKGATPDTNFGASPELQVKRTLNPGSGRGRQAYLRFDTSSVTGTITRATLRVYGKLNVVAGANRDIPCAVFPVSNSAWTELGLTWVNKMQPNVPNELARVTVTDDVARWYEFDITAFINSERAAGRTISGVLLRNMLRGETGDFYTVFNSKEAAEDQPQLVIEQ